MIVKEFKKLKGDMMKINVQSYHGIFTSEETYKVTDKKLRILENYLDDNDISFSERSGLAGPQVSIEGSSLKEVLEILENAGVNFNEVRITFYIDEKE